MIKIFNQLAMVSFSVCILISCSENFFADIEDNDAIVIFENISDKEYNKATLILLSFTSKEGSLQQRQSAIGKKRSIAFKIGNSDDDYNKMQVNRVSEILKNELGNNEYKLKTRWDESG